MTNNDGGPAFPLPQPVEVESTTLSGPPDTTGSKNDLQSIGSTISYLQRYTLLALTGLATFDMDDDATPGPQPTHDDAAPNVEPRSERGHKQRVTRLYNRWCKTRNEDPKSDAPRMIFVDWVRNELEEPTTDFSAAGEWTDEHIDKIGVMIDEMEMA